MFEERSVIDAREGDDIKSIRKRKFIQFSRDC